MFEKWSESRQKQSPPYVSFSNAQMYISTGLLNEMKISTGSRFDLLVDKEARLFSLVFHNQGEYNLKTIPGQVTCTQFIRQMKPVLKKHIPLKREEGKSAWVGRLDGEAL